MTTSPQRPDAGTDSLFSNLTDAELPASNFNGASANDPQLGASQLRSPMGVEPDNASFEAGPPRSQTSTLAKLATAPATPASIDRRKTVDTAPDSEVKTWPAAQPTDAPATPASSPEADMPFPAPTSSLEQLRPRPATPPIDTAGSSDPLGGWDPSAPLDTSSPLGLTPDQTTTKGSETIPSTPIGQTTEGAASPAFNASLQSGSIDSQFDSSQFDSTTMNASNWTRGAPSDGAQACSTTETPAGASPISGGINTGRVVTMAVLGALAFIVFMVLLSQIF